jgi:pantoate--beta-alanine ligase
MRIVSQLADLDEARGDLIIERFSNLDRRPMVGFAPTMGALHAGHRSLLERMRECDLRIVSIFVNPLQFGAGEDLARYPRTPESDHEISEAAGVDIIWSPEPGAMYPPGYQTTLQCGELAAHWCGALRPGHFDGVATVVAKLFGQVRPDRAYFGEKDYQQLCIARRLSADLDLGVEVVACPTLREPDGLAMSSRNAYLTAEERAVAPRLHEALVLMKQAFFEGETDAQRLFMLGAERIAGAPGLELEYLGVADPRTLIPRREQANAGDRLMVAARLGKARLIDNEEL